MYQIKTNIDRNRALDILEHAFHSVPGVMWIIENSKRKREHLRIFLSYCFYESSARKGAYLTSDNNGVVFFYRLQNQRTSFLNFFRKIYLIVKVIGIRRCLQVMKTKKIIDEVRPKKGWFGWFLATRKADNGNFAGYEIKKDMFRMADETCEPIYVETTVKRIMTLYTKIGFHEYARIKHPYADCDVWFMKREPHTRSSEMIYK